VEATIIELDGNPDGNEIQAVLGEITGARTVGALNHCYINIVLYLSYLKVPRVFIDGKFIGGGTDIKRMFETGALQKYFQ